MNLLLAKTPLNLSLLKIQIYVLETPRNNVTINIINRKKTIIV
jgi:hypothetical protein